MLVLLIRHAHAGKRNPIHIPDDTLRPITQRGRAATENLARYLLANDLIPTTLFTSPWLRAHQTAECLSTALAAQGFTPQVVSFPLLAAPPNLRAIRTAAGKQPPHATPAFIGHEPWLGQFAAALLAGSGTALEIDFPKSGVIGIETASIRRGQGTLRFFVRPTMLPSIA